MTAAHELEVEREYVEGLYRTIDAQREAAIEAVRPVLLERQTGFGAQFERDRLTEAIDDLRHHLDLNVNGLCFGKLVATETHATTYIGRISLNDDHGDPLLVDWRAPVASAFYQATAIDPMGVMLRRHLIMAGRDLVGIEDDLLTVDALGSDDETRLVGEAALLAALTRERTGHMGDIVATIQRDQDEIIRTPLRSTLVVTGGPGTGKTVVALHRAAYLLYAYRHRIANNGVLVVGPSNLFLRYVERVLPSLGESSVVLIDWSDLVPGMTGQPEADPTVADLKGSLSMVEVLRRAVRLFERAPAAGVRIIGLDGMSHLIDTATLVRLRAQARAGDHPHNVARRRFERLLRREMGLTDTTESGYSDVCRRSVAAAAGRLWPVFEPDELLGHLFANERVLAAAARGVLEPGVERALLREAGSAWTVSDLPLLDELRVLLGSSPRRESAPNRAQYEAELQDAQQTIKDLTVSVAATCGGANIPVDAIVTPEMLVDHHATPQRLESIADQARRDPEWKYAHIVVDEAQDVTPMQWRALARRSQNRSMTIVGDPDQMSRPTDEPWIERITSALGIESCDQRSLHINYRTPADVVRPAHDLRAHHQSADGAPATTYVREGTVPWAMTCAALDDATLRTAIEHARQQLGDRGRLAVISSTQDAATTARVIGALEGHDPVAGARRLLQPVASYLANEVKGLEFDAVVVVDPSAIADEFGWRQLYVVLTRPTTQLGIITVGDHAPFEHAWFETGTVRALG